MNLLLSAALIVAAISFGTLLPTGDGDTLALKKGEDIVGFTTDINDSLNREIVQFS